MSRPFSLDPTRLERVHTMLSRPRRLTLGLVFATAGALVVTVADPVPAAAERDPGPVVVVESRPNQELLPDAGVIQVTQSPAGAITVDNPGNAIPIQPQCASLPNAGSGDVCIGGPATYSFGNGLSSDSQIDIRAAKLYGGMAEESLAWIEDEAVTAIAAMHDIAPDDLLRSYGRPAIRAYVVARIKDILNKKLYGEPLTANEQMTYESLVEVFKKRDIDGSKQVLAEYNKWEASPCGYDVPKPPPGSGFGYVPNPLAATVRCLSANPMSEAYRFTNQTPSVDTFETWARYRHPNPALIVAANPQFKQQVFATQQAMVMLGGFAAAIGAGAVVAFFILGVTAATLTAIAGAIGVGAAAIGVGVGGAVIAPAALAGTLAAAIAGAVFSIVVALVLIGLSIWKFVEDQRTVQAIKDRATQLLGHSDDPLGIQASQAAYADLDYQTLQDPSGAGDLALIHQPDFNEELTGMVAEWTMFDAAGNFIADPETGFPATGTTNVAGKGRAEATTTDVDKKFVVDGTARDLVVVKAADGTVDDAGKRISAFKVSFSRGYLMVSPRVDGVYQPAEPNLSLYYVDEDGNPAQMSIAQHADEQGRNKIDFLLIGADSADPSRFSTSVSSTWTFASAGGVLVTAGLQTGPPVVPEVSLMPTVNGTMLPDHTLTFQSNVSAPGQGANGTYSWVIQRLNRNGGVAEGFTRDETENLVGFQQTFATPGDYRATVRYHGDNNGVPFDVSGSVAFALAAPLPEVFSASLDDSVPLDGKLFLDLRLAQQTPSDTFDVGIEWADDGAGNRIVRHYTVNCRPLGDGTCETDRLIGPEDGPVNPNWSESPTFRIPADQAFLPFVTATITNGFGASITQMFKVTGENRPRFADPTPHVSMPVGTATSVRVSEVIPAASQPDQRITILPYADQISASLPEGIHADVVEENGHTYIDLAGSVQADDMGPHTFYLPVEQEPAGSGLRATPALVTLDVVPSVEPGYRALLTNVPGRLADRVARSAYPDYYVNVALKTDGDDNAPFTGTVMCRLTGSGTVVFEKPCAQDEIFPWPKELVDDDYQAEVWATSDDQAVVSDHYVVHFATMFIRQHLAVDPAAPGARTQAVHLGIVDPMFAVTGNVPTPYSENDYAVECKIDAAAGFTPCLDDGILRVLRSPGDHEVQVRVTAPDGAVSNDLVRWRVLTPPTTFDVRQPSGAHRAGSRVRAVAVGLLPHESYTITMAGHTLATGSADAHGKVDRSVVLPRSVKAGQRSLVVTGATKLRRGHHIVRIVVGHTGATTARALGAPI